MGQISRPPTRVLLGMPFSRILRRSARWGVVPLLALISLACSSDNGEQVTPEPDASPTATAAAAVEVSATIEPSPTSAPPSTATAEPREPELQAYPVPAGSRPHDVAPAADGGVWYTGQGNGTLGLLDPASGEVTEVTLGPGSAPHGVIVGPEGDAWITDGGLNAMVRVDAESLEVTRYDLPPERPAANLNTASFDNLGRIWFTGQAGIYGRLDPRTGEMTVWDAPRGRGPYGITTTPHGAIYYASLAGNYLGEVDVETGEVAVLEPPTPGQGTRRVWTDSTGRLWCAQWNVGQVAVYDPASGQWQEWALPGDSPSTYAVYVDENDGVWLTDFGGNAIHRFDPETETFETFALPSTPGNVRQLLGRAGEVWGAESAADQLVVIRY